MGGNVLKLKSEELIEQGIEAFILDKLENNCPEDEIIARLQKWFRLTEEKATLGSMVLYLHINKKYLDIGI